MNTAQDQHSRAAYEDGKWYWVEHEGWHGEPPTIAPACYKAECDAWYSYIFSGISTPYLKVLEPCELQAALALPARGVDPMLDTPAGMEPLCYLRAAAATTPARAWQAWENDGTAQPVYTAAQVLATGCVPPVIYKAAANYLALLREERRQLDRFLLTDRGFFRAKLLDGKIEELEEQLAVDRQVPAAPEVATGPCGQCKDARQPCQCALDTILKERGLVAVNRESFQHMVTKIAAASAPACWCAACDSAASPFGIPTRMSLCPKCGDKRCPRAQHHSSACSAP